MTTPQPLSLNATPYLVAYIFVPLLIAGMVFGGVWTLAGLLYAFLAAPIIDQLTPHDTRNLDPSTPDSALSWHRLLIAAWVPTQLLLISMLLFVIGRTDQLAGWEIWATAISLGVANGAIGITYAHELIHQRNRVEPLLGEVLLCSVLYGHFRIEHVFGHHVHVATRNDPATARAGETIYTFWGRSVFGGLLSAWRIQADQLARRGRPIMSLKNAFWRYAAWTAAWLALAYALAGTLGVGVFVLQAVIAFSLLELVNYLEHYGLERREDASGRFEATRPHHSWNANHRFTNWILINLQRHSDHHFKPARRFPVLQSYGSDTAPQLPHGYAWMVLLTLVPPLWFHVMDPRVAAWRSRFYPDTVEAAPLAPAE